MNASIWGEAPEPTKRPYWKPFEFGSNQKPANVEYGRRYLCLDIHGNMAVCRWDISDWCIYVEDFNMREIYKQMHIEAAAVLCEEYIKTALPKTAAKKAIETEDFDALAENVAEKLYEMDTHQPVYFDDVEWYMELPSPPHFQIESADGKDVAAEMFDQKMDLLNLVEQAIDAHLRKRRIEDKHDPT